MTSPTTAAITNPNGMTLSAIESAKFWADITAVTLAVLTAAAGVFAWYFSSRLAAAKDAELSRFQAESRVAILSAEARAAEANEKTAQLAKEAANARLETEKIKQVVTWRVVPQESAIELEKALASKPGSVNLRYTDGDPEALFLTIQISQILTKAHWQIAPGAVKPSNAIVFGIDLPDATGVDAQTLRGAFSAAKVPFSTNPLPEIGVSFSISVIPGAPTLMVGSKAPPQLP